jgi:hypothetical protein
MKTILTALCLIGIGAATGIPLPARGAAATLQTRYARIRIDQKGFITSLVSLPTGKEYSPASHPSPMMSLHEYQQPYSELIFPTAAVYEAGKKQIELKYPNGTTAVVKAVAKDEYFRFQLVSLTPRGDVDNIVWGPLHTSISEKIGDLLGVVRSGDWAIGMLGLDDNAIAGPPADSDCYEMGYYIHSPDPKKYPVPPQYHEGERFRVGGDGVSDQAFYSHPEEYFQQVLGTGAKLEPEFGSSLAYHSRDRRKIYTYLWSLLPDFDRSRPRHQVTDPVDADFMGSAVALYACPDDLGLHVIESVILAEGLPHPMIDGKWVHDPTASKPCILWSGPHDKLIEYVDELGMDGCSCLDWGQGEYYANPADHWLGKRVEFTGGRSMTYREFTDECKPHGIKYGLHTLCLFLQGGRCTDVTPVPSEQLQTVCRTKLASDISATDTNIVVTALSFLAEKGTWPLGDDSDYLRIGGEMLRYGGITKTPPYMLKGVERGHASKATAHQAGDEVVKLQQNCYNGFCPDMKLMLKYADYYATVMAENGMQYINFDGLESTLYMNQGYYGVRVFLRRLFDTYGKLTGGLCPIVTGSCIFAGGWVYMAHCGGGLDPVNNCWSIEGKDSCNGFGNSYISSVASPNWRSDWSVYDAENLEAKSIGWNAAFDLSLSQGAVEPTGEKDAIFKAFRTWENARAANVFTSALKEQLKDLGYKFHLEQTGKKTFVLHPVKEVRLTGDAGLDATQVTLANPDNAQPLQFALQVNGRVSGCVLTLPDGTQIKLDKPMERGQFILCKGNQACLADKFRKKIAELPLDHAAVLPHGESKFSVRFPSTDNSAKVNFGLTAWILGKAEAVGS